MDFFGCLFIYALTAVIVAWLLHRAKNTSEFLINDKSRRLGPTYWGVYQGSSMAEASHEQTITPPKPCKDMEGLAGSGGYAGGKAVQSSRS